MLGLGQDTVTARKFSHFSLGQYTANNTVTPAVRFGVPLGGPSVRLLSLSIITDVVPLDADGVLTLNALVKDISEGADDTIVSAADLETLVTAANQLFKITFAAETSEKELTIDPGDTLRFQLVSNSAAIDTNPNVQLVLEYLLLPIRQSENALQWDYVNYRDRWG